VKLVLPRRTVLRGLGTAMALPVLEAMVPDAKAAAAAIPLRLYVMFFPIGVYGRDYNGRRMGAWRPASADALSGLTLSPILEPLNNYKSDFSIVSGLNIGTVAMSCGEHAASAASFLTVHEPPNWKVTVDNIDSMDQIIGHQYATTYGHEFPVLVTSPNSKSGQDSFAPAIWVPGYSGHISYWNHNHVDKWTNPLKLFDALFTGTDPTNQADVDEARRKKSVLDYVLASSNRLSARLGSEDKARLGQYMDSVRDIESRLMTAAPAMAVKPVRPPDSINGPNDERGFNNTNYPQRVDSFIDIALLAMQAGLTGVANIMLDSEFSTGGNGDGDTRVYTSVPDFTPYMSANVSDQHHSISHTDNATAIISINRYQTTRFARLIDKMKAVPELGGTLFDNSMILYGCGICDSNEHHHLDLPILVSGRGGGMKLGQHVWYQGKGRSLADLHLTLMQRMGVNATSFSDSAGTLSEI
jgi:hypothetical protein